MDPGQYLDRLSLDSGDVSLDRESLRALQKRHVKTVPFETLSITGHPFEHDEGSEVSPAIPDSYRKVVERDRGGFCYELNGAFGWLLTALGFETSSVAGRVVRDDDGAKLPANHRTNLVTLDRTYLADVGMGVPTMRRPLPTDGTVLEDDVGVEWRVVESDRPDAEFLTQYRTPGDADYSDRYLFDTTPRETPYFEATCEYLRTAPESGFTGDPVVSIATEDGHEKLSPGTLVRFVGEERTEREVDPEEYDELLQRRFGVAYDG
jgi:N-hydroxyarylamine O-acetyltransferase